MKLFRGQIDFGKLLGRAKKKSHQETIEAKYGLFLILLSFLK